MKQPTTITEAIEQLEKVAKDYFEFEGLCAKVHIPKMERQGDLGEDEKTDSDLHLEIEGWICITPFHTKEIYPCIGGDREGDAIHYSIQRLETIHGTHYYPDGSGQPDDVDIVEVKTDKPLKSPTQAIEFVYKMLFDNELSRIRESIAENEMVDEEEQWGRDSCL